MPQHKFGRFNFPTSRALVMGILNATPDSFSDGGQFAALDYAMTHAEQMIRDGADIIDIGGESSRPGAPPVALDEELRRVMPLVFALRDCGRAVSVDTYKPAVMREAVLAGVDMINDINGFRAPGAIDAVQDSDCALCIMHMLNNPTTMQAQPEYNDVVREVTDFLAERIAALTAAGIDQERLWIDPGFGFGKTVEHNYALLKADGGRTRRAAAGGPVAQVDDRRRHRQTGGAAPGRQHWRRLGSSRTRRPDCSGARRSRDG
jgi:dihydropteroate synthase